jgi:hypothetical protein
MSHGQRPPQYGPPTEFQYNNGSWWDAIVQALPHSGGVQVGVSGEASDPGGTLKVAGSSAVGGGIFWDPQKGWSTGDYASAGGLAKGPGSSVDGTGVVGTSGSAGASFWISNATSNAGLQNTNNNTYSCNAGVGPIQGSISVATGDDGTWVLGFGPPVAGYSFGASCSGYPTTTKALK